ncbi:hydroxypyruvate isomerase family protein [Pollutimonas harenae]|uniref:TIM barrel protein n=1 Tax=Pollutimonas harenae TaxID=657015 RepID=A0A853H2R7_9BURK|nr:TIM barrel protein [Pollutimonas harenae]NYT84863.1 TIM barrel protein [Pollutimonas harenae]TEA72739.1 hydroxypyruvate isomerase [Pollutimonas harenae]
MKLAANLSLLYPGLDLQERMAMAARDGFHAVEILFPYEQDPSLLAGQLQKHGLKLVLINTPVGQHGEKGLAGLPGRDLEFMAGLERALNICRATGCRSIHVMAGIPPDDTDQESCRSTLIGNLRKADAVTSAHGITLLLEALNREDMPGYFYHLPSQAADIIKTVASPSVRLQFDFYHCQREQLDLRQTLRETLSLIHHVQFANPQHRHEPNLDDAEVRAALLALQASGYQGWLGCEYRPKNDTSTGLIWRKAYDALLNSTHPTPQQEKHHKEIS